jgi:hypothetical protein
MVPARQPLESASAPAVIEPKAKPAARDRRRVKPAAARRASEPPAPVVVTLTQRAEHSARPSAKALPPPGDYVAIAQELQKELRRVGCYDGPVTGLWTPSVRNAMKEFIERVNAALPIERPDNILLRLVQGHQGRVCGRACPSGEGLSPDGRCLPNAILARGAKRGTALAAASSRASDRPAPAVAGWSTTTAPARPAAPPPDGRMALAGPNAETDSPGLGEVGGLGADHRAHDRPAPPPRIVRHARPDRFRAPPRSNYVRAAPRHNLADRVFRSQFSTF